MMRLLSPLCLFFLLSVSAFAQQPPPGPLPQRPVFLTEALQAMPAASVGDGAVALTVGSRGIMPVPSPPPPETDAGLPENPIPTPQSLAARYGRLGGWFGHVYALAPPTMTVLSSNPALADLPLSVLASQHPTPFLIGSFSPEQLQQMAGEGLAFGDLTPDQQALVKTLLPHPFQIVPKSLEEPRGVDFQKPGADINALIKQQQAANKAYEVQARTVSDEELAQTLRLHAFLASEVTFDSPGAGISMTPGDKRPQTSGAYKMAHGGFVDISGSQPEGNKIVSYLKAETANVAKEGDLTWTRRDLEHGTSLEGIKVVDDLVARLARATGLELYADTHYGRLDVLVVGDLSKPQPAADVMQALAVCVCGAWRQVGSAYVLTDDVQGLGARQEFLREIVQTWSGRLTEASRDVGGHLRDAGWLHTLHFAEGDSWALASDQVDAATKECGNGGHLPWKSLPDPLRQGVRDQLTRHYTEDNMKSFEQTAQAVAQAIKPDTSVEVTLKFQLAISLPETGAMTLGEPYRVQAPRDPPTTATASTSAPGGSVSIDKPLRGVLCALRTPEEARAIVALLPKMGLNTLFLDVFTGGRTYFPNAALPPEADKAAGVLRAALDAARLLHIPIYAVMDTLCWRKDGAAPHPKSWPAGYDEDLTVGGEAPDHAVQRELDAHSTHPGADREYEMASQGNEGWASPLDPKVRALLPALVRGLAGVKGLAGLAFQDTATMGYRGLDHEYDDDGISLGYTPTNRLAYLRAHHADPVDFSAGFDNLQLFLPFEGFSTSFDVTLPNFRSSEEDAKDWNKMRADADKALLADCFAAAHQATPALPLLMRERQVGITFDPWTDPKKPNQYVSTNSLDYPFRQINAASILTISYGPAERAHPRRFVWMASDFPDENGKKAGGEIFDLVTGYSPDSLTDTLDRLGAFLKKPPAP